jgi:hypothetical protein
MSHLLPCPGCNRHVVNTEASCPFCSRALDLADRPAPELPRGRLGRAATFAFGASIVGATALVACSGETEDPGPGPTTGGAAGNGGASTTGGANAGGSANTGGSANSGGSNSAGSGGMMLDDGGVMPLYGLPGPVYGAPP